MISVDLFRSLTKEQLIDFFKWQYDVRKVKKPLLIEQAVELLKQNDVMMKKFYNNFSKELAMTPYECEEFLECTTTERRRWTKEGKFKVVKYHSIEKYGKIIEVPMYDRFHIELLSLDTILRWRNDYEQKKKEKRIEGGQKAMKSRLKNEHLRDHFAKEWKETRRSWQKKGSLYLAATFELAFWTMWLSRWAKENNRKSRSAIKYGQKYKKLEQNYYLMKNKGIKLLFQTPFASLSFYRPEDPDKWEVTFCPLHFELFKDLQSMCGVDKWTFFYENKKNITKCKDCGTKIKKDYYSLYYMEIKDSLIPDYCFSFHTPYPIGIDFFPSPAKLAKVSHTEQIDGLFRFGRPVFDEEKIIYREKDVLEKWQDAYKKMNHFVLSST